MGCVPSAAVVVSGWGLSAQQNLCPGGVCLGEVSAQGSLSRGVCLGGGLPRGCLPRTGVHLPPCGQTDASLWKHSLSASTVADGNYNLIRNQFNLYLPGGKLDGFLRNQYPTSSTQTNTSIVVKSNIFGVSLVFGLLRTQNLLKKAID